MATSILLPPPIQTVLQTGQGPAGAPPKNNISSITYDVLDRVTGYSLNGAAHVVTYPNATTIVDVGGGSTKTVTLDGSGRITDITVT